MAAKKFQMSDGRSGMLRGQAPDPDAFQAAGMPKRSYRTDTEHERQAVKPHKGAAGQDNGFIQQCNDVATQDAMERAMRDKLTQTMNQGIADGYAARIEEENSKPKELTDAEIDEKEDKKRDDLDDIEALRARRRQQMKEKFDKQQEYKALGHGEYDEIQEEQFLKTVTSSHRCVVHFYHRQFQKCKVMDMHLRKCAKKFMGTRIVTLDAEKSPFFVEKLGIRTLPCAIVFVDGVAKDRQVGFDGLTDGGDEFSTVQLAWRLKEWGGIEEDFDPDDDQLFE